MSLPAKQSYNSAVARVLGLVALAPPPPTNLADPLPRDAFRHNVGDCGCSTGGPSQCGTPSCVCRNRGTGGDVYMLRMPDGSTVAVTPVNGSGGMVGGVSLTPTLPPDSALISRGLDRTTWDQYVADGFPNDCVPYRDAIKDGLNMVPLASNILTLAAGASGVLTWAPPQGWLDAYYIDFSFTSATGANLAEAHTVTYPVITGCPASSCISATALNGRFMQAIDGCCNGRPFRALVQRASDGGVLTATVTNNTAGATISQGVLRGFCRSNRVCV